MEKISEKSVARLWKSGRLSHFQDDMGNEVVVICVGRVSTKPGCDFQDVVIAINNEKLVGDVELHLSSDLWQKHGHHTNPAYNGIILHVAMWQRGQLPVKLEDGTAIPTVILNGYISERAVSRLQAEGNPRNCCRIGGMGASDMRGILLRAGMERFKQKSTAFAQALEHGDEEQVLYKGICRALGYSRNTAPFEDLAGRLPLRWLNAKAAGSLIKKKAIVFGSAGLLPSQGSIAGAVLPGDMITEIEKEWAALDEKPSPLSASDWNFSYLRPGNHPVRRLTCLCHLLQRYEKDGLIRRLSDLLDSSAPGEEAKCLEKGLLVEEGRTLLGRGRAAEIAVNQVLPFLLAYAVREGNLSMVTRSLGAYLNYRALPDNELLRYMKQQLRLEEGTGLHACAQQGLLHIYHAYCRTKDCPDCPVFTRRRPGSG